MQPIFNSVTHFVVVDTLASLYISACYIYIYTHKYRVLNIVGSITRAVTSNHVAYFIRLN